MTKQLSCLEDRLELKDTKLKRKYAYESEFNYLIEQARQRRRAIDRARTEVILRLAYQHGLRAEEIISLKWKNFNFETKEMFLQRSKNQLQNVHPIKDNLIEALWNLYYSYPEIYRKQELREHNIYEPVFKYVILNDQLRRYKSNGVGSYIRYFVRRIGMPHIHLMMLRHGCGYKLVNKGVDFRVIRDYMGHKSYDTTLTYTYLEKHRFEGIMD